MKRMITGFIMLLFVFSNLYAQAYLKDLANGDIAGVEKKLDLLGTSFKKEPVLAVYLNSAKCKPEIVQELIKKGANVNQLLPNTNKSPLCLAVTNRENSSIVKIILDHGAAINFKFKGSWGSNIIDYALASEQYKSAAFLITKNNHSGKRVTIDQRYAPEVNILSDNVDAAKKIIAEGTLSEQDVWNLAISGKSKEILKILTALYDTPDIDNDTLRQIVTDTPFLKYLVSLGFSFSKDQIVQADLYRYMIQENNSESLKIVHSMDLQPRPELYTYALDAGLDYFKILTSDFKDLTSDDLYNDLYIVSIFKKSNFETIKPILQTHKPAGYDLIKIYKESAKLFALIVNNSGKDSLSIGDVPSYDRKDVWELALDNNDKEGLLALAKVDSDVPTDFIKKLLQSNNQLFMELADHGLRTKDTDQLWYAALPLGNHEIFEKLELLGKAPGDLLSKALNYNDSILLTLLESGYSVTLSGIPWENLVKNNFSKSILFLMQKGYKIPGKTILLSLAYNENLFLSLLQKNSPITRTQLGTETVTIGRNSTPQLILDVAVENGYVRAIKKLDELYGILNYDPSYKNPDKYPWDYWAKGDQPRGRKLLSYYDVIHKGDKRGYGPDGYNDFMTNNFNVLVFVIAVKYNNCEVAKYVVERDPSVTEKYIFSNNEMQGEYQYRYSVSKFIKEVYRKSPCLGLVH